MKWHEYGGKGYLAGRINALRPNDAYLTFASTHAGGMAVELEGELQEGRSEIANDKNGWLMNFWRVLRDPSSFSALRTILELTPFSREEFEDCTEAMKRTSARIIAGGFPNVEAAHAFFVACRQSLAGRMKGFASISTSRVRRGMNEQVSAWLSSVEGLDLVHDRLKRWFLECRDAADFIALVDKPETLFYSDPPYYPDTRVAKEVYEFEMTQRDHAILLSCYANKPFLTEADFLRLDGNALWSDFQKHQNRPFKGRFMLSGYDCELYQLAKDVNGWRQVTFKMPNAAAGGKEKRIMTESVWMNYDPPAVKNLTA